MLCTSFTHLPGIGVTTAKKLNSAGVYTWDDACACPDLPLKSHQCGEFLRGIEESRQRLEEGDALWFSQRLSNSEQWRLFPHFHHSAAYVDIETTGLAMDTAVITSIALYDGENLKVYVNGHNLEEFLDDIETYKLLVTWNGRGFDVPFIRRALRAPLQMAHLDLVPVFHSLGLKGGLKKVEKILGLSREELDGVDGYTAVQLWHEYELTGQNNALETLLAYNAEDVFSLELLASYACAQKGYPVKGDGIKPQNPFTPDLALLARLNAQRKPWGSRW
ncbi:ribonuclease H-like domain-containing protein [Desulfovibrio sp. OttesenSCG-928-F07]|nr:ribonuclease H-like domain-containing protein [Desulfovibrio sp. OttesenSCG-928-F07]